MLLRRHNGAAQPRDAAASSTCMEPVSSLPKACQHELLQLEELPQWFQSSHGTSIFLGFRPVARSYGFYLGTLFFWHNETINTWSHLLGAMLFVAQIIITADNDDAYMLSYRLAAASCFAGSAAYHLFMPLDERWYARLQRADYAAIFLLIGVSAIPYYSVEFRCHRILESAAVVTTALAMLLLATLVGTQDWFSRDHSPRGRLVRVTAFSTFALALVVFGGLAIFVAGFSPAPYFEADPMLAVGLWTVSALYTLGPVVYASGWPEKLRPRSLFDLLGASHQWMHVCVLAAALLNGWCMERARELRLVVRTCDEPVE